MTDFMRAQHRADEADANMDVALRAVAVADSYARYTRIWFAFTPRDNELYADREQNWMDAEAALVAAKSQVEALDDEYTQAYAWLVNLTDNREASK